MEAYESLPLRDKIIFKLLLRARLEIIELLNQLPEKDERELLICLEGFELKSEEPSKEPVSKSIYVEALASDSFHERRIFYRRKVLDHLFSQTKNNLISFLDSVSDQGQLTLLREVDLGRFKLTYRKNRAVFKMDDLLKFLVSDGQSPGLVTRIRKAIFYNKNGFDPEYSIKISDFLVRYGKMRGIGKKCDRAIKRFLASKGVEIDTLPK